MAIAERERTAAAEPQPHKWNEFERQYIAGDWRPGTASGTNRDVDPSVRT
jgi:hypothetical protein